MPLQEPFGDIGIPHRERRGNELAGHPRGGNRDGHQSGRAPARKPQTCDEQQLDHHAAIDDVRRHRHREVLRQCPRRGLGESQRGVGQVGTRGGHRVTQKQVARRQQGRRHRK